MFFYFIKIYCTLLVLVILIYTVRHYYFSYHRSFCHQRRSYYEILDSNSPKPSIIIPMHNEEAVATNILEKLLEDPFVKANADIIVVNDHSKDRTKEIIDEFILKHPTVRALHRSSGARGKPAALNDALKLAKGEIVIIFDADYLPPKGMVRNLTTGFLDPEVSCVMGRVVPLNEGINLLTRLITLERSGGYQVDQQARFSLGLTVQYGGTVGGFRKSVIEQMGGFDVKILAEDTDLTFKCIIAGWKVHYMNMAECYEEVPEDWSMRARQVQRWSRGHNQVLFKQFMGLIRSQYLSPYKKLDAILLLFIYAIPFMLLLGIFLSVILFLSGDSTIFVLTHYAIFITAYYGFGNFAPFYQICCSTILDGHPEKLSLLPLLIFKFFFSMYYASKGFLLSVKDTITKKEPTWAKTQRYREKQ